MTVVLVVGLYTFTYSLPVLYSIYIYSSTYVLGGMDEHKTVKANN